MHNKFAITAASLLVFVTGCVPQATPEQTDAATKEVLTRDTVNIPDFATGKFYLIGTLAGPLTQELSASFSFTPYDGTSTDAPIFIADTALAGLTDPQKAGIIATLAARNPILLVHAGAADINTLIDLIQDPQFDFVMPDGVQ